MKDCDHDKIYSGAIKLGNRFPCICRKCGEQWDDATYELHLVDLDQYHALRVAHGWAAPKRLPSPPRLPQIAAPAPEASAGLRFVLPVLFFFFSGLFVTCGISGVPFLAPWGIWETVMPRWMALLSSGAALATATVCYVAWKRGL